MTGSSATLRAFLIALQVCILSVAGFLYVWFELRLPFLYTERFLLGTVLAAIALLTVSVYQSIRVSSEAKSIAKGMAENMYVYSQELFTELYRGSPVPYLVIDHSGSIDSANYAAVRLFGVETGWLEGKEIFKFIDGENEQHVSLIPQYFAKRVFVNNEEVQILRPDGETRWVRLSLFSFKDAHRTHKGLMTLFDVTKQKEIDRAKTEFVSLASHQLRTPISALRWNIELLETAGKDHLTEGDHGYITKLKHAVSRMDSLIKDFLSVSKLELGTLVPHTEPVSFGTFIESILESFENQIKARQLIVERDWNDDDSLQTDPQLLEMAVSNLISNAVKYTLDGGTIRISFGVQGKHVAVSIADTGMGIPENEIDGVFTKIFRATNAKSAVPDGTGLGLYIARESMRVMGGDITFITKQGEGTTFTILLPR